MFKDGERYTNISLPIQSIKIIDRIGKCIHDGRNNITRSQMLKDVMKFGVDNPELFDEFYMDGEKPKEKKKVYRSNVRNAENIKSKDIEYKPIRRLRGNGTVVRVGTLNFIEDTIKLKNAASRITRSPNSLNRISLSDLYTDIMEFILSNPEIIKEIYGSGVNIKKLKEALEVYYE